MNAENHRAAQTSPESLMIRVDKRASPMLRSAPVPIRSPAHNQEIALREREPQSVSDSMISETDLVFHVDARLDANRFPLRLKITLMVSDRARNNSPARALL